MSHIKNIIFDLGEVLIKLNFPLWFKTLSEQNPILEQERFRQFYDTVIQLSCTGCLTEEELVTGYRLLTDNTNLDIVTVKRLHNSLLFDGPTRTASLLGQLARQYSVYLLSNTDPWHAEYAHEVIPGFHDCFVQKIYSYDARSLKPEQKIYDYLQKKTGIDYRESVYFDDSLPNIEKGNALGIRSVLVENEEQLYGYVTKHLLP